MSKISKIFSIYFYSSYAINGSLISLMYPLKSLYNTETLPLLCVSFILSPITVPFTAYMAYKMK